jgi:hypothetical protein
VAKVSRREQGDEAMKDRNNEEQLPGRGEGAAGDPRAPYEAPRIRTGPAFERVLLASSACNDANIFEGCTDPCG